jgi:hypothetical protein
MPDGASQQSGVTSPHYGSHEKKPGRRRRRAPARQEEPRLVLIEWEDSFGCSASWENIDGPAPSPLRCRSVGWLIHDTDSCKVVVPHVTEPHDSAVRQGCGDMTIPARAILRVVDLSY